MHFNTPKGLVFEPQNPMLRSFYETLEELAPTLGGSPAFDKLIDVYEALEFDTREETDNEPAASA